MLPHKPKTAFALGGLGGFNAHGVGFLKAAQDQKLQPDMITCTSGQVVWVAHYLAGHDLEKLLLDAVQQDHRYPEPFNWLNSPYFNNKGLPGVFRLARFENMQEWFKPWPAYTVREWLNRALPAREFIPTRSDEDFRFIAETINKAPIPVMFNSLNPALGLELLHMNEAALAKTRRHPGEQYNATQIAAVTPEAVQAALWLYCYGFERSIGGHYFVDGAFRRQMIVTELSRHADVIFAVRPLNRRWIGEMPQNQLEMQDLKTMLLFNSVYFAETAQLRLMNNLISQGLVPENRYHKIHLEEIEPQTQPGFFNYFIEDEGVYRFAYSEAYWRIGQLRQQGLLAAAATENEVLPLPLTSRGAAVKVAD